MGLIEEISEFLQKGRSKKVKELVQKAMDENMDPKIILNEGLLSGMMIVGAKFKNNEVLFPPAAGYIPASGALWCSAGRTSR